MTTNNPTENALAKWHFIASFALVPSVYHNVLFKILKLFTLQNGDQRNILTTVILVGARYFTIRLKFHVGNENIISSINV